MSCPKGDIRGAEINHDNNQDIEHSILDFEDRLKNLPAEKYKIVDEEVVFYN